jgi:hypothetical protein
MFAMSSHFAWSLKLFAMFYDTACVVKLNSDQITVNVIKTFGFENRNDSVDLQISSLGRRKTSKSN